MMVIDAVTRLVPGVIEQSIVDESFSTALLEYPHYTRPVEYRGHRVPESSSAATTPTSNRGGTSRRKPRRHKSGRISCAAAPSPKSTLKPTNSIGRCAAI